MVSVKLLTEIPAGKHTHTCHQEESSRSHDHQAVLTFEEGVQNPLLDLGLLHHVGGRLSEDELARSGFEAVPVVFDDGDAVLHEHASVCGPQGEGHTHTHTLNHTLMCSLRIICRTLTLMSCSPSDVKKA